jgi:hypothetical protein
MNQSKISQLIANPPYQDITLDMVLRRADFPKTIDLLGRKIRMTLVEGGLRYNAPVAVITGVNFDIYNGLWLSLDIGYFADLPLRGVQYVVWNAAGEATSEAEGWWIGLGNCPKGLFLKLDEFELLPESPA